MSTETSIRHHSGNKYLRLIRPADGVGSPIWVDIYAVIEAFAVTCPGIQHAAKKLLCAGIRGKGDRLQDLRETIDALRRAIELQAGREAAAGIAPGAVMPRPAPQAVDFGDEPQHAFPAKPCGDCGGDGYFKGPRLGDEPCSICGGTGEADSGGVRSDGHPINVPCECSELPMHASDPRVPHNAAPYPISELIERLQKMPPGTTFRENESAFYGGQAVIDGAQRLGTAYQIDVDVIEGWVQPTAPKPRGTDDI